MRKHLKRLGSGLLWFGILSLMGWSITFAILVTLRMYPSYTLAIGVPFVVLVLAYAIGWLMETT